MDPMTVRPSDATPSRPNLAFSAAARGVATYLGYGIA
jgi:hypothetical protein